MDYQCGLCSKSSLQSVRISKCSHVYCSICILEYLSKKRKFCPLCVPMKQKNKKFYYLTYFYPVKLLKRIKKQKKKIYKKHLIPITERENDDQNNIQRLAPDNRPNKPVVKSYAPITVEKEINQTNANDLDLNNNDFDKMENDKQERIKELLIKNENLRIFLEKISELQNTMSSLHKLNELKKLNSELVEHQTKLKEEADILRAQVDQLKELSPKFKEQIKIRNEQQLTYEKVNTLNEKFKDLADDYRDQNEELNEKYKLLIDNFNEIKILD